MLVDRRSLLASFAWLAASPALAGDAPSEFESYERESGGRIGLYAENLATGKKLSWRADERFVMCSTFKASLAASVLARVDRGEEQLAAMIRYGQSDLLEYAPVARENLAAGKMSVGEMCKAIVELSDNTCANLLLARIGGPAALTAFWRSLGDTTSRLDHNEPELNRSQPGDPRDTTTPAAMAGNLRRLVAGEALSPASRALLTDWMVNCKTGANRLRGGLPAGWKIGDKTGNNGKDASGDIAVAWPKPDTPILIAAYTQGGTPSAAQITSAFARIGRMVAERLA
ncbi:class A beta-lactamase [Bradyrhizobium sp. IC3069]|uniref:class A beta-lactamase n=1 Tax=unclassified Bradyrhizobium TaxID=2631580 RepID=UPI001CD1FEE2|nr:MULTISPECIES: class A beta-lactamase [unclassified Bradyrhizobium]MCA1364663.1 class A beta-lactamase [Bradyrhizobium sp. IC4059]MCA1394150.1 class A beta-lactamase [Bradyrhizobium sp. IC3123]MCA1436957.1 class A beta-lactamase [Bradyrhizobium sp. BRP20]MCA1521738.1 class A beta-lactamase [Bradyrhizobium sp. IC3069]